MRVVVRVQIAPQGEDHDAGRCPGVARAAQGRQKEQQRRIQRSEEEEPEEPEPPGEALKIRTQSLRLVAVDLVLRTVIHRLLLIQFAVGHGVWLERKGGGNAVLVAAEHVRQGGETAGGGFVLRQSQQGGGQEGEQRNDYKTNPNTPQGGQHAQGQQDELPGACEHLQAQPEAQQNRVPPAWTMPETRQGTEHQTARDGGHRAAPVVVHPLVERAELHHGQQAPGERPGRTHPRPQHPVTQRTKQTHRQHHACPGQPEHQLPERQREPLAQRVDRTVSRALQHEHGLKKPGHWMSRIGQAEMRQRVAQEKVAEVIRHRRHRYRMVWQQQQAQDHGQSDQQRHRHPGPPGDAAENGFGFSPRHNQYNGQHREAQ